MELSHLQPQDEKSLEKKEQKAVDHFNEIIDALNAKEIDENTVTYIHERMASIQENFSFNTIKKEESKVLDFVNKQHGYVAQNHYKSLWIALGMSAIGVPIGVGIGLALDQLGFMGIGIAMGLTVGIIIGSTKDKEAKKKGKQLHVTK